MLYAFRVYAAIYGHRVVEEDSAGVVHCYYSRNRPPQEDRLWFHIPALYGDQGPQTDEPTFTRHRYGGHDFFLRHGIDPAASRPDWLGEIFLWLSGGYEANIRKRDRIGRVPYSETVFALQGIPARKPHASLLMAWMENAIRNGSVREALPRAPSPQAGSEHLVLCSHDIDFYFTDRRSALIRLVKNLGIAIRNYRSWSYFQDNLRLIPQAIRGGSVGSYLPALIEANAKNDVSATFFVVSRPGHRRDPHYRVNQIAHCLREVSTNGHSVGLHGSYRSIVEDRSLAKEACCLAESVGRPALSNRQHWLRFGQQGDLFAEVAKAEFLADSSLGFPDTVGFRNGASFAFPPYDFEREAPYSFLEIPLVLMDGSLEANSRKLRVRADGLAEEVLEESRKCGWGGVAVLWHNPLEPLSVPAEINQVFWKCADRQKRLSEKWVNADQFLATSIERYQQAGLLKDVSLHN